HFPDFNALPDTAAGLRGSRSGNSARRQGGGDQRSAARRGTTVLAKRAARLWPDYFAGRGVRVAESAGLGQWRDFRHWEESSKAVQRRADESYLRRCRRHRRGRKRAGRDRRLLEEP